MTRQKRLRRERRRAARAFTLRLKSLYQLQILLFRLDIRAQGLTYAEADEALALQRLLMAWDGRNCEVEAFHLIQYHRRSEAPDFEVRTIRQKLLRRSRGSVVIGGYKMPVHPNVRPMLSEERTLLLHRRAAFRGGRKARRAARLLKASAVWRPWMTLMTGAAGLYGLVANWAGRCVVGGGV